MDTSPRNVTGELAAAPSVPLRALAIAVAVLLTVAVGCAPRDGSEAAQGTADAANGPCARVERLYDGLPRPRANSRGQPAGDSRRAEQTVRAAVAFRLTTQYPDCFTEQQRSDARAQFEEIAKRT